MSVPTANSWIDNQMFMQASNFPGWGTDPNVQQSSAEDQYIQYHLQPTGHYSQPITTLPGNWSYDKDTQQITFPGSSPSMMPIVIGIAVIGLLVLTTKG